MMKLPHAVRLMLALITSCLLGFEPMWYLLGSSKTEWYISTLMVLANEENANVKNLQSAGNIIVLFTSYRVSDTSYCRLL